MTSRKARNSLSTTVSIPGRTRQLVLRCRGRISHELNEFNESSSRRLNSSGMHHKRNLVLPLLFTSGLSALALIPSVRQSPGTIWAFLGAASALLMWNALLASGVGRHRKPQVEVVLRKQHYLQACVQGSLLLYWGWYWPPVYAFAPFILAQLLFAYAFDMLLVWSRRDTYTLGFAPFPVVVSINLFLWFKPDWFYLQFAMVALGLAAKGADSLEQGRAARAHLQSVVVSAGGVFDCPARHRQERHHLGPGTSRPRSSIRRTCTWCCFCSACRDSFSSA